MLEASRLRILERLGAEARVLDVGGGASPFERADWVIDLLPYAARHHFGVSVDPSGERFSEATWVQRDICDREPWPFEDGAFDFVVCSHTLEDVRDPIFVCSELVRVARAGYIEVPSRLEEQSYGVHGPWIGWTHHRWLIDREDDELVFVSKPGLLAGRIWASFPESFWRTLSPEQRVTALFWENGFRFRERIFLEPDLLDAYVRDFVAAHYTRPVPTLAQRVRRRLARAVA